MATSPTLTVISGADSPASALPFNIEAEKLLLGAIMLENRLLEDVMGFLEEQHFYEPLHGRIYAQLRTVIDANRVANPVTLRPLFERDERLAEVGGAAYLLRMTEDPGVLIAARDCARQIYDLSLLRALVRVGADLVQSATDTSTEISPKGRIEAAEAALYKVAETGEASNQGVAFKKAAETAINLAAAARRAGGGLSGVTTGLTHLNSRIGGLQRSDLIILAGRPGMGKTALATNIAFAAGNRHMLDRRAGDIGPNGAAVAFFSLEMSADQLANRILVERSGVPSHKIRSGQLQQQEFNEFVRAAQEIEDLPLFIDDTPALTIAGLRARARRLKRRHDIGLIVVDYLQLLSGSGNRANDNRVNEISEISRGLKTLAKELAVPVLALSQLSRAVESRDDKIPQLSDLRESGSIEQDADIVLFVFREEYYERFKEPPQPSDENDAAAMKKYTEWKARFQHAEGKATIIVAKNRHGSTGSIDVAFDGASTRFSDLAESAV